MDRFLDYTVNHYDKLIDAVLQHLAIVGLTLLISIALAMITAIVLIDHQKTADWIMRSWSMVYAIPSLALFALLLPLTGLGIRTAVVVLVLYNQYILVRAFVEGLCRIDPGVLEAANGMGMTKEQILKKIRFPLAVDAMAAGIRIAIISTIGIATIAATIGAGGLGRILFDGMRTQNSVKIIWGTVLSVLMVLLANAILKAIENRIRKRHAAA